MDAATLSDEVNATVERLGGAEVVVGLATAGPIPALAAVAAAVRAGLDAHCAGQAAAIVHVDQTPSEATAAAVAAALGDLRLVPVPAAGGHGDDGLDWASAVRAVLTVAGNPVVSNPDSRRLDRAFASLDFMVSVDTVEDNKAFAEKEKADFPLLSDPGKQVATAYGVVNATRELPYRWTFYIGPDGIIRAIDKQVKPASAGGTRS